MVHSSVLLLCKLTRLYDYGRATDLGRGRLTQLLDPRLSRKQLTVEWDEHSGRASVHVVSHAPHSAQLTKQAQACESLTRSRLPSPRSMA